MEGDLKAQVADLSVLQTEDSHPDLSPEARADNNASRFTLDFVQVRCYEVKTVSRVLMAYKELRKVGVIR